MARAHYRTVLLDPEGDVQASATVKVWAEGTGSTSGSTTTGSNYAGDLYSAVSGGSPISHTLATNDRGELEFWCEVGESERFDLGVDAVGGYPSRVVARESFQFDPPDILRPIETLRLDSKGYGVVSGSDSDTRAANTTAFQAAVTDLQASRGKRLYLGGGEWWFNALTVPGSTDTANFPGFELYGDGKWSTQVRFGHDGTDPGIRFGGNAFGTQEVRNPTIRDLTLFPGAAPDGYTLEFLRGARAPCLTNVDIICNGGTQGGIKLGEATTGRGLNAGMYVYDSRIDLIENSGQSSTGIGIAIYGGGALKATNVDINGKRDASGSYGVRFLTSAGDGWDTVDFVNCVIKDHAYGVRASQAGQATTATWIGTKFDGIGVSGVELSPSGSGYCHTWTFDTCWFFSDQWGLVILGDASAPQVYHIVVRGSTFLQSIVKQAILANGAYHTILQGNIIGGATSTVDTVSFGATEVCKGTVISGNQFVGAVGNPSGSCLAFAASEDQFAVTGNIFYTTSGSSFNGCSKTSAGFSNSAGTGATQVVADNVTI